MSPVPLALGDARIEQALQAVFVVVRARAEIGDHLERPALAGVEFEHLLLPL
jgi:hypothetical protein